MKARRSGNFEMVGALTTVTDAFARVSMHGIREELLRAQLEAAGLPAFALYIPFPCPNELYEQKMSAALEDELERVRKLQREYLEQDRRECLAKLRAWLEHGGETIN